MAYPANPPRTEVTVHTAAIRHAAARSESTMGTIITSGGIGKTELSAKETSANHHIACGCAARSMTRS